MIEFFTPEAAPFTAALLIMILIGVIELVSLVVGFSPVGSLDSALPDVDLDAPDLSGAELGPLSVILGWLSIGRIPLLVWLVIALTSFALAGYGVQLLAANTLGTPLHAAVATIPALLVAIFASRFLGNALARVFPRDQSDVASQRDLLGSRATIIRGEARPGQPAEAKATDLRGRTHYLLVEPEEADETFAAGASVLLIRQQGNIYRAVTKLKTQ